jgi:hypothetical protein
MSAFGGKADTAGMTGGSTRSQMIQIGVTMVCPNQLLYLVFSLPVDGTTLSITTFTNA